MKKRKNEILSIMTYVFFVLVMAYGIFIIATQEAEIERLKAEKNNYSGYVFSTVQIWNEETEAWETYQGTLDFDCGLHGEWLYEVNGLEAVLTGARHIGTIYPDGEPPEEYPTAEEGKIVIYTDTGEIYTFYGTVVTPLPNDEYLYYMPTAELVEFANYYQEGESDNEE